MVAGVRHQVATLDGFRVVLMDSITYGTAEDAGQIIVAASHGGRSSARYAIALLPIVTFLNDAGIGKDDAGLASLAMLDRVGRCGLVYDGRTAKIGDARDAWENGVISHVNQVAADRGFRAGEAVKAAVHRLFAGADHGEKSHVTLAGGVEVAIMDSTGYGTADDAGKVIVAGSHGGLVGVYGDIPIRAIFTNDAGPGKDNAGIASFAGFDALGVPAAAYDHDSARIGDGLDAWENGVISHLNDAARRLGLVAGEKVQAEVRRVFGPLAGAAR